MQHDDRDDGRNDGRPERPPRHDRPAAGGATDEDTRRGGDDPANDRGARWPPSGDDDAVLDAPHDPGRPEHLATGSGGSGDWGASAAGSGQRRGPVDATLPFELGQRLPADGGRPGGPTGREVPDARIHDDVSERLSREAALDAGDVTVAVREGRVTLTGTVADLPVKHAIASLVDRCHGVREIDNRIKVMRGGLPPHPDAPPMPRRWVPRDSPTARDEAEGRHTEPTPDASGRYG